MRPSQGKVLSLLRDSGGMSRADLARRMSLSAPALTKITAELIDLGFVAESTQAPEASVGRPPVNLGLNADASFVIGLHLGPERLSAVMTNLVLETRQAADVSYGETPIDRDGLIDLVVACVEELIAREKTPRTMIAGIGIGMPGRFNPIGEIGIGNTNEADGHHHPFTALLEQRLGIPVQYDHNAASIALGEIHFGAGRGRKRVLYAFFAAGLGAGLAIHRPRERATSIRAVEVGHISLDLDGKECRCGGRGCLETELSEGALLEALGKISTPPEGLVAAMMDNEALWAPRYAKLLQAFTIAVNLIVPDIIIFGGHFGTAPDAFFEAIRRDLPARVLPELRDRLELVRTSFRENASALGASALALERFVYCGLGGRMS